MDDKNNLLSYSHWVANGQPRDRPKGFDLQKIRDWSTDMQCGLGRGRGEYANNEAILAVFISI